MKPDGFYNVYDLEQDIDAHAFKSEKELCDFIESNISEFCHELGFKYLSHKREFQIQPFKKRRKGSKRIDFLIKTECGKALGVECKHPKYKCELSAGIGQMLSYLTIAEIYSTNIDNFYMVSSVIDDVVPAILSKFDLPITFIVMDKTKSLTWQGRNQL